MNYALMKDSRIMCKTPRGVEWHTIFKPLPAPPLLWPTREGAQNAAEMQGAAVVPSNQVRHAS